MSVDWEVVFLSDSDCEFVEPQTVSFSRKREASVALECETVMNFEGPPVKAVPESVRRRPTRQRTLFKAAPRNYEKQQSSTRRNASTTNGDLAWSTEVYNAISDPEFGAIHAWKSRDRVIIRVSEDYLARKSEDVSVKRGRIGGMLIMPNRCGRYHKPSGLEGV